MMDLRSNPRAVAAARRIQAETGFDVLDDAAVGQVTALCAARRSRALRSAAISGVLVAALLVAFAVVGALGRVDGYALFLGPALLLLNGFRLVTAIAAARKLGRIPRSIEAAQARVRAAAADPEGGPGAAGTAGAAGTVSRTGALRLPPDALRLPPDVARWN